MQMAQLGTQRKGVPSAKVAARLKQLIELPPGVQRHQLVAAANMPPADEDLRHRAAPTGAAGRFRTLRRAVRRVDLAEGGALLRQQVDGTSAVWTPGLGVNIDHRNRGLLVAGSVGGSAVRGKRWHGRADRGRDAHYWAPPAQN